MQVINLETRRAQADPSRRFSVTTRLLPGNLQCAHYAEAGIVEVFVQDNHSRSIKGTLRGLHYQSHLGKPSSCK